MTRDRLWIVPVIGLGFLIGGLVGAAAALAGAAAVASRHRVGRAVVGTLAVSLLVYSAMATVVEEPVGRSATYGADRSQANNAAKFSAILVVTILGHDTRRARRQTHTEAEPT